MKKLFLILCITLGLTSNVLAQAYNYSTSCEIKVKEVNCGACPDKITLKLFDEYLDRHDSLMLDEMKFSYQIDQGMSSDTEDLTVTAVYGRASSERFIYMIRTYDYKHPVMNAYQIWLSNKQKDAYSRSNSCFYSCGITLTQIKK